MESPDIHSIASSTRKSIPEIEVTEVTSNKNVFVSIYNAIKKTFVQFCSVSSISGFSYLTSKSFLHRIIWLIVLLTSLFTCYFYIGKLFGSQEILVVNEKNTIPTSEIPFPAITVCTSVKADHRKFNLSDLSGEDQLNEDELNKNQILKRVFFVKNLQLTFNPHNSPKPIILKNIETNIIELGIKEKDLIESCSFNDKPCAWSQILTPDGLCYAFNLISPGEMFKTNIYEQYKDRGTPTNGWSYKNGYDDKFNTDVYPHRGFYFHQLKMRLKMNQNDLINSNEAINGFKIYAGHPVDYPSSHENKMFIPLNVQYTLTITPDVIKAQDQLMNYPFKLRNCFVTKTEWNHLKIFKEYTLNNCYFECMGQKTQVYCICNQFYFPDRINNQTCGYSLSRIPCYTAAIENQMTREIMVINNPDKLKKYCNCYPACSSVNYVIQEQMTGTIPVSNKSFYYSDVIVKFSSSEILPKTRKESYSILNFVAAIGGNLGLFVGASVTSFFELIYYFSIKFLINVFDSNA